MPVGVQAKGIHHQQLNILVSQRLSYLLESAVTVQIIFIFPDKRKSRLKIQFAFGEIQRADVFARRFIFRTWKMKCIGKIINKQFRKPLQRRCLFIHPPLAVLKPPALLEAADVGKLWCAAGLPAEGR